MGAIDRAGSTRAKGEGHRPVGTFALLLLIIATTELAVMELFAAWFDQLPRPVAGFADALLLVVGCTLPLWFFFAPCWAGSDRHRRRQVRRTLAGLLARLLAVVFCAELAVMLLLPGLLGPIDGHLRGLVDAALIVLCCAPYLWHLLAVIEERFRRLPLTGLLDRPLRLYLLLLYIAFLADLLQELVLPYMPLGGFHGSYIMADALLSTLIVAPFLWLFVVQPLRASSLAERVRAGAVHDQVIDAIVVLDDQGRIESLNPAAERIFGYERDELTGRSATLLFADAGDELQRLMRGATADGDRVPLRVRELAARTRAGAVLTADVSISRITIAGSNDYLLILRDVSERRAADLALRESDERFRQIYEQSEDAILFCKPGSSYVIDVNGTAERLFGYRRDELRGEGLARLFAAGELPRLETALCVLAPERPVQFDQLAGRRRDGSACLISLHAKIMTLQGMPVVYCTLRDVTERVRLEEEAREIQARLIQANKMTSLGLLVSGVAHEINNPNNYIQANAQLLARSWDDALKVLRDYRAEHGDFLLAGIPFAEMETHLPQLCAGIADGSRRIDNIVASLKQVARPEEGGTTVEIDLNQVVGSAVTLLQHELVRATENFRLDLAAGLPRIRGNGQQLGQVVINLLSNACQALPSRRHGISLTTAHDPAAGTVRVEIADQGTGISAEDGQRIMEPFFTTKLDRGGTGLGLSICRTILHEHHGTLTFASQPGAGTTFTISLPAAAPPARDERA